MVPGPLNEPPVDRAASKNRRTLATTPSATPNQKAVGCLRTSAKHMPKTSPAALLRFLLRSSSSVSISGRVLLEGWKRLNKNSPERTCCCAPSNRSKPSSSRLYSAAAVRAAAMAPAEDPPIERKRYLFRSLRTAGG